LGGFEYIAERGFEARPTPRRTDGSVERVVVVRSVVALAASKLPIELIAPAGLALLALLVPLVVLYILKVRRKRLRVASTWLWAVAQRDLMARAPFKRLLVQLPLILQALAVFALGLALARPATRSREVLGDHVAIIVDTSASMSALSPKPGGRPEETVARIELAKAKARELVASLRPSSDAMILEAGREATVVSPLERDTRRIQRAIDRLAVRDLEGDLGPAIALAADRLRQLGGSSRIVVVTDGHLARRGALSAAAIPIEVMIVGAPVDNAAIVRVDVRSGVAQLDAREEVQAFVVVANYGRAPRDVFVTMREDNASDVLASRRVLVAPGEKQPTVLTFHPTPGDYRRGLIIEITPHDDMSIDDVAYARVPAGDTLPVYLVSPDGKPSPWLARAFAADRGAAVHVAALSELETKRIAPDALVVVQGACPAELPGGDLLIVAPPMGSCFGTRVGALIEHPLMTSWATGDPRMRFLTLDGVHVARANALEPAGTSQELIRTQEGTIATDISTPAREATLLGFDVGDSDWPLKASFVLFARNLIEQARAHRAHGMTGPLRAGEPMRLTLPQTARTANVTGPSGISVEVAVRNGLAVVPNVDRAGLYNVSWQGPHAGSMVLFANLTSEAESDLRDRPVLTTDEVRAGTTVDRAAGHPDAHHEWTWALALIALGLVLIDVWYLTRKTRVASAAMRPSSSAKARA
jgi:hypothetical protein